MSEHGITAEEPEDDESDPELVWLEPAWLAEDPEPEGQPPARGVHPEILHDARRHLTVFAAETSAPATPLLLRPRGWEELTFGPPPAAAYDLGRVLWRVTARLRLAARWIEADWDLWDVQRWRFLTAAPDNVLRDYGFGGYSPEGEAICPLLSELGGAELAAASVRHVSAFYSAETGSGVGPDEPWESKAERYGRPATELRDKIVADLRADPATEGLVAPLELGEAVARVEFPQSCVDYACFEEREAIEDHSLPEGLVTRRTFRGANVSHVGVGACEVLPAPGWSAAVRAGFRQAGLIDSVLPPAPKLDALPTWPPGRLDGPSATRLHEWLTAADAVALDALRKTAPAQTEPPSGSPDRPLPVDAASGGGNLGLIVRLPRPEDGPNAMATVQRSGHPGAAREVSALSGEILALFVDHNGGVVDAGDIEDVWRECRGHPTLDGELEQETFAEPDDEEERRLRNINGAVRSAVRRASADVEPFGLRIVALKPFTRRQRQLVEKP